MAKPLLQLGGALGEGGGALKMRTGGLPRVQKAVLEQGGRWALCRSPHPFPQNPTVIVRNRTVFF